MGDLMNEVYAFTAYMGALFAFGMALYNGIIYLAQRYTEWTD